MVNFSVPYVPTSSNRIPARREEANANIAKMENDFFSSFGVTNDEIESELNIIQGLAEESAPSIREQTEESMIADVKVDEKKHGAKTETTPKLVQEWECICDHTKNARISDLYRKFDAFKEIGGIWSPTTHNGPPGRILLVFSFKAPVIFQKHFIDVRLNIWSVRKRQFESKFGPRLKDELRRTVLPDPIEPDKEREINEDTIWLSDIDRQLIRFIHKPPLNRLKNFNKFKEPIKGLLSSEEKEVEEEAIMERCDFIIKNAIRRADKIFTQALKEHIIKLKAMEKRKYNAILKNRLIKEKNDHLLHLKQTMAKLENELNQKHKIERDKLIESMSCELENAVKMKEAEIKGLYGFKADWTVLDNNEKAQDKMRLFHRKCLHWVRKIKREMEQRKKSKDMVANTAITKHTFDLLTKLKKHHTSHLFALESKHGKNEKSLLSLLVNTTCDLEEAKKHNTKMTKEKSASMELVKQLMNEYQKFISYCLKEEPGQGEFLLGYQRMFQLQLDQASKNEFSDDSSEEDFNSILLSKLKVKLDQKSCPKSSSDDDAIMVRKDIHPDQIKTYAAKKIIKEAIVNAIPTPIDSEVEMPKLIKTKSKICTCCSEDDLNEFKEEKEIIQAPLTGRYINALDYMIKQKFEFEPCDVDETKKGILKQMKTKKAKTSKVEKRPKDQTGLKIIGETSSDHDLEFEQFKKKRIRAMVQVLRNHPTLMKRFIK